MLNAWSELIIIINTNGTGIPCLASLLLMLLGGDEPGDVSGRQGLVRPDGLRVAGATSGSPTAVLLLRRRWASLRTECLEDHLGHRFS